MAASIEVSEEQGVRYLHFGSRWIQGAMRVGRPWALELDYTRVMMVSLLLRAERGWPRNVLAIGLGAASLPKFLYRCRPRTTQTIVEIDAAVVDVAHQCFSLPSASARLAIEIGDGADYVARAKREFDLILVDGFDAKGMAGMLDMLPFYCNCAARLSRQGVLAANLLRRTRGVAPSLARLAEAFRGRALALPACASGNTIALAAVGEPIDVSFADLLRSARNLRSATGLNLLPTLACLREAHTETDGRLQL